MNKVIILAAGKGTRMNADVPKVLVPINGRPMIEHLLNSIIMSGVDNEPIIVVSPENRDVISNTLHSYKAKYVIQDEQRGTGHAVACAIKDYEGDCKKAIVFNGDHPFVKIGAIKSLADSEGLVSMLTAQVEDFEGWQKLFYHWGRIVRDSGSIKRVVEFKDSSEEEKSITEINPGMYAFDLDWLKENIDKISDDNAQQEYYLTDLIGLACSQDVPVLSVSSDPKEVIGINSREELDIAETFFK